MRAAARPSFRRTRGVSWVLVALCVLLPRAAAAQDGDALYLSVQRDDGRLDIRIGNLFSDEGLSEALHSGLPLRIRIVADLWKDGFFDDHKGQAGFPKRWATNKSLGGTDSYVFSGSSRFKAEALPISSPTTRVSSGPPQK